MNRIISHLNHTLTRIDAMEASARPPIRRYVLPTLSAGLAGSLVLSNYRKAVTAEGRKKTLLRDVLVLTGSVGGILAGVAFTKTAAAARMAHGIGRLFGQSVGFEVLKPTPKALAKLEKQGLIRSASEALAARRQGHHHHHAAEAGEALFQSPAGRRLGDLFHADKHSHGPEGFVVLESVAAGAVAGGGLAGLAADALNGEDTRTTGTMKLKEGIFQFLGNITLCTAAILAVGRGVQGLAQLAGQLPGVRALGERQTLRQLQKIAALAPNDIRRRPASVVESVETAILQARDGAKTPAAFRQRLAHHLEHAVEDRFPEQAAAVNQRLQEAVKPLLQEERVDLKALRQAVRQVLDDAFAKDFQPLASAASIGDITDPVLQGDVARLAQGWLLRKAELPAVVAGVGTGIVGGAWASNHLNEALSKHFNLPDGHQEATLFHSHGKGFLEGKVGDRGIHWWDAILHVDDWPSALYLAGVRSLESMIWVLYGISGYLTGAAGATYAGLKPTPVDASLFAQGAPLKRRIHAPS